MREIGIYILFLGVAIHSTFTRLHVMRLERRLDKLMRKP